MFFLPFVGKFFEPKPMAPQPYYAESALTLKFRFSQQVSIACLKTGMQRKPKSESKGKIIAL
jgi:hypothetical protein